MRLVAPLLTVAAFLSLLSGCGESTKGTSASGEINLNQPLLAVDFVPGEVIRYNMVSEREIVLKLEGDEKSRKQPPQTMNEKLNLVIAYEAAELDPYGLSTIKATVEKASVTRTSFTNKAEGRDAAELLAGRSYTFKLSPNGTISDYAELQELVSDVGSKAFTDRGSQGRIKEPEMIWDFVTLQWSLWDPIRTIPNPARGVKAGQRWEGMQLVPLPMPIPVVRDTTFQFVETKMDETSGDPLAIIDSTYKLSEENAGVIEGIPQPYTGKYRTKGMFGFLRNYKFKSIDGQGKTVFDIEKGRLLRKEQTYTVDIEAAFMLPLGESVPTLKIDQTILVEQMTE